MAQEKTLNLDELRAVSNPAFRFVVEIDGVNRAVFTECTMPTIEWEVEEIKEGGLNTHSIFLPGRRKGARLTLKNGVGKADLFEWYQATMGETFDKVRRNVTIQLLNGRKEAVMTLSVTGAFPVKWSGPQLKSDANTVAIESLELACGYLELSRDGKG